MLRDAIEVMPNTLMLWDKDNKLITANKSSRDDQKKLGFDLKPGASRLEMVKKGVDKGVFIPPKGQTKKQFILKRQVTKVLMPIGRYMLYLREHTFS